MHPAAGVRAAARRSAHATRERSSPGSGPARWVWPKITCARVDAAVASAPRRTRAARRGGAPARRGRRAAGPSRARFSAATRAPGTPRPSPAGAARLPRRRPAPSACHACAEAPCELRPRSGPPCCGDRVDPGVDRRERSPRSPRRAPARRRGSPTIRRHHAGAEPLEHRHGRVAVAVVAVHGVHVVAQPHPRVGDAHARRAPSQPASRASGSPSRQSTADSSPSGAGDRSRPRRSSHAPSRWWSWLPGTITTSRPGPSALADRLEHRPRGGERVAQRPVAKLEHVPEQHQPVAPGDAPRAARARGVLRGAARRARARAQMQVGDDQRAQRPGSCYATRRPPSPGGSPWGA